MYFKRQPINGVLAASPWQSQPYFQGLAPPGSLPRCLSSRKCPSSRKPSSMSTEARAEVQAIRCLPALPDHAPERDRREEKEGPSPSLRDKEARGKSVHRCSKHPYTVCVIAARPQNQRTSHPHQGEPLRCATIRPHSGLCPPSERGNRM